MTLNFQTFENVSFKAWLCMADNKSNSDSGNTQTGKPDLLITSSRTLAQLRKPSVRRLPGC